MSLQTIKNEAEKIKASIIAAEPVLKVLVETAVAKIKAEVALLNPQYKQAIQVEASKIKAAIVRAEPTVKAAIEAAVAKIETALKPWYNRLWQWLKAAVISDWHS